MTIRITMTSGEKRVEEVKDELFDEIKNASTQRFIIAPKTIYIIDNIQCIDIID